ncbi:MAG TPA: TlpA family protein disulfide reductase [Proteobacteria bacterium]|nr:TlpA family protein disulfide reductase [Pseudomonadota bacterium]
MQTFLQITTASVIIFTAIFSTACNNGSADSAAARGLKIAPDFNLKKLEGGTIKLSDYRGKVIILDFWATWCPPCRKEIPDFVELQKEYGDKGLIILGISLDQNPKQALPAFIKKYKVNYPILLTDGKVDKSYGGVTGIPTTFIIDRKGEIYKHYVGFRPKHVFATDIKALLN